jgi:hypothetical protein
MGFFKDKVLGRAEMYWKVDHGRKTGNDEEECSRGLFECVIGEYISRN